LAWAEPRLLRLVSGDVVDRGDGAARGWTGGAKARQRYGCFRE